MAPKFKAQLDDLMLEVQSVDDGNERSFVEFEFPGADGSEFEDQGRRARRFTLTAFFFKSSYDDYWKFREIADAPDTVHNFVHPAEGLITGVITDYNTRHDERQRTAEVTFTVKEQLQGDVESKLSPLIQPQIEELFAEGQTQLADSLKDRIFAALGPGATLVVSRTIDATHSLASQFIDASRAVRDYVGMVDDAVAGIQGFVSTIEQPANSLIASIEYAETVPGLIIGSVAQALDRYVTLAEAAVDAPVMTIQSFYNGALALRNAVTGFDPEINAQIAMVGALLSSQIYTADNDDREQAAMVESVPAWNSKGEYIGKAAAPAYMTADELERSLVTVRTWLQTALDDSRDMTILQDMAAMMLRHVNTIKIERERTFSVDISTEMPLLLILHGRSIPIGRADRVLTLNPGMKNPSFVFGPVVLYE